MFCGMDIEEASLGGESSRSSKKKRGFLKRVNSFKKNEKICSQLFPKDQQHKRERRFSIKLQKAIKKKA